MLTLRPAFVGTDKAKLLRDVLEHEPPALRSMNSAIPKDLETIVLKAISKDPADRYSTAAQMVDDLQSFGDNRPIKARRPGPLERLTRWTRRHRAVVTATLVTGLSLSLIVAVLLGSAFRREATQRRRVETEAIRVRESLDLAREAVDDMYVDVANTWISDEASMSTIQRRFLRKALALYDRLAAEPGEDFATLHDVATARHRRGEIYLALWQYQAAETELEDATTLFELLLAEHPDRPELRADLALTCQALAATFEKRGLWDAAIKTLEEGHDHAAAMVLRDPASTSNELLLADNTARRVGLALRFGHIDEANNLLGPLRDDVTKLAKYYRSRRTDESTSELRQRAQMLQVRAELFSSVAMRLSGDLSQARIFTLAAGKLGDRHWRSEYHDSRELAQLRIEIATNQAEIALADNQLQAAEQHFRRALALSVESLRGRRAPIETLHVSAVGKSISFSQDWETGPFTNYATLQLRLGSLLGRLGRPHEAESILCEALHTMQVLSYTRPGSLRVPVTFVNAWSELALLYGSQREADGENARDVAASMWRHLLDTSSAAGEFVTGYHGVTPDCQWFAEQFPDVDVTTGPKLDPGKFGSQDMLTTLQNATFIQRSFAMQWFRTESWQATVTKLEPLIDPESHSHGYYCLMLAIAHAHLGHHDQSAHWQQEATSWLKTAGEQGSYWEKLQTQLDQTNRTSDTAP